MCSDFFQKEQWSSAVALHEQIQIVSLYILVLFYVERGH